MSRSMVCGAGWRKGDPEAAVRVIKALKLPLERAWMAQACDTFAFELIQIAMGWVDDGHWFGDPLLDETHAYEDIVRLRAVIEGARCVPDACDEAKVFIIGSLDLISTIWAHLDQAAPKRATQIVDRRWQGIETSKEQFFAEEMQ